MKKMALDSLYRKVGYGEIFAAFSFALVVGAVFGMTVVELGFVGTLGLWAASIAIGAVTGYRPRK